MMKPGSGRMFLTLQALLESGFLEATGMTALEAFNRRDPLAVFFEFLERCARESAEAFPQDETAALRDFVDRAARANGFIKSLGTLLSCEAVALSALPPGT